MKKLSMKKLFVMFLVVGITCACHASVIWHYTLDEATGTTAYDSAGVGSPAYDGTLTNATGTPAFSFDGQSVTGKYGTALSFRGPSASNGGVGDDYISISTTDTSLPGAGDDFTVSMWVKTSNWGQGAVIFSYNLNNLQFTIGLNTYGGVPEIEVYSKNVLTGVLNREQLQVSGIDNSIWHSITVSVDDGDPTIYLDGIAGGGALNTSAWAAGSGINFGRRNSSTKKYFTGAIDEFTIVMIPEPTTIALLGIAGLSLVRRKK